MIKKKLDFHHAVIGGASMAFGMFMFGIGNVLIKKLNERIPVMETLSLRSIFGVLSILIAMFILRRNFSMIKTPQLTMQVIRGSIGFLALYLLFLSFDLLPLVEATVLSFAVTLFITVLSFPILKEKVGMNRWVAVIVGFIGVIIISRPNGNITTYGVMVALGSAFIEAIVMLMSRILSKQNHPLTSVFYHTAITAIIATIISFLGPWKMPTPEILLMAAVLGFCGAMGHVFIVYAYSVAPAVVVAPMIYTLSIWGVVFGYLYFNETISASVYLGTPIIILSGLYILYREQKRKVDHIPEVLD